MRGFFGYILAAVLCLSLSGCSGTSRDNIAGYQQNITGASVTWIKDGREYSAEITIDGVADEGYIPSAVTVTAPENISGMKIEYSGDSADVSVGGVSFALTDNMGNEVYRIVKSLLPDIKDRKGAGGGTGVSVLYECDMFGSVTSFDISYGEDRCPKDAKIIWDEEEITVRYECIVSDPKK